MHLAADTNADARWPGLAVMPAGRPPRLLDVGCSAGGLMLPFQQQGWEVYGTDPDTAYALHGKETLKLNIEAVAAEDMNLPAGYFDLVIITGSLEHVYDINQVLQLCRAATAPNGLLLIEGRAWGYGILNTYFNHNHRRYLRADTIAAFMRKYGWEPVVTTEQPLCGPTRPGGVYVLGQAITNGVAPPPSLQANIDALRAALCGVHGAVAVSNTAALGHCA
jgi:SAM-dependent methyltransferase